MTTREFKVGDLVKCVSREGVMAKKLKPTIGEVYMVTQVDPKLYTTLLNIRRLRDEHSILTQPLFASRDFKHVQVQEVQ